MAPLLQIVVNQKELSRYRGKDAEIASFDDKRVEKMDKQLVKRRILNSPAFFKLLPIVIKCFNITKQLQSKRMFNKREKAKRSLDGTPTSKVKYPGRQIRQAKLSTQNRLF